MNRIVKESLAIRYKISIFCKSINFKFLTIVLLFFISYLVLYLWVDPSSQSLIAHDEGLYARRARLLENNEVYLLEDNILKSKSVDVIIFQNDSVVIKGLNEQDCIVNQYRHYFHDGMSIN